MQFFIRAASSIFLVLNLAVLSACESKPSTLLRIGTNVWPGYEALYLADHLKYYEGTGNRVIAYPSATTAIRDFKANQLEAVALTIDEALLLASAGGDFKIVAVFDISHGGDVLIGTKGMQNLAEIKGKRIALEATALGSFMLSRALEHAGLVASDITPVNKNLNQHEQSIQEKKVDAVVTFHPVATRLINSGYPMLFDSTKIPGEIVDVLLVHTAFLEKHPSQVESLLTGYFRALQYQQANFDAAVRFISQREGVSPQEYKDSLKGLIIPDLEANRRMLGSEIDKLTASMVRLEKIMRQKNLLPRSVDVSTLLDGGPVQRIKP